MALRCFVMEVLSSLLESAFWMLHLSAPEGQTSKCRSSAAATMQPNHDTLHFYIILNVLNHLRVGTFRWRDGPEVTTVITISQMRSGAGNLRFYPNV